MKNTVSKVTLILSMLAVACMFTAPMANAADTSKAEKKKKREQAILKKYDKNANGKLDPDEDAARKADAEKAKEKRRKKKGSN